jgi:ligand-binding sensor domain-containing protein/signal transduction histidine kinase
MKPHTRVDCEEVKHPGWRAVPLVGLVLIQGALAGTSGGAERIGGSAQSSTPLQAQLEAKVRRLPVVEGTDVQFNRISRSQGLSQTRVTHIVQDARGFMWFGTQYGLDRYDGYKFKVFTHDPENSKTLCGVYIYALFKDRAGNLWVACDQSLDRFDPQTESFAHFRVRSSAKNGGAITVRHISEDTSGMLWLATWSGLYRLDPNTGIANRYQHRSDDPFSLSSDEIKSTGQDRRGVFWVSTKEGLDAFDREAGRVTLHVALKESRELSFYEDRAGTFWILSASNNGLAVLDRKSLRVTRYSFSGSELQGDPLTGVSAMLEDREGTLWVGTLADGILKFDREHGRFIRYRHEPANHSSLAENRVTTLIQDREGNVWAGLGATEPVVFHPGRLSFRALPFDSANAANLGETLVNAIYEGRDGQLWTGTTGALNRVDDSRGRYTPIPLSGAGFSVDVLSIIEDRTGALWVATSGQGLKRLDPLSGSVKTFLHDRSNDKSISNDTVTRLFVDRSGTLWAATADGLNRWHPETANFSTYKAPAEMGSSVFNSIAIERDHHGSLWLGSHSSGLFRFDPTTQQFTVFTHRDELSGSLTDNRVNSVYVDEDGIVWAGTQNGLDGLDPKSGRITRYFEKDGLANNAVSCILEDEAGDLWLGTNAGLSRFNRKKRAFTNYSTADGLPGPDLTGWGACFRSASDELFFGGFAGAVSFRVKDLVDKPYVPPVVLTDFELSGISVPIGRGFPLSRAIDFTNALILTHRQDSLSIEFSALSFSSPTTNRYRYMLVGLDEDWHEVGSDRRVASYTTLPPGVYRFRVQGATSRGPWSTRGAELKILVQPPWWSTWWFTASVATALMLLLLAAYSYRIRQIAYRFAIRLEERVGERTRIARELHDSLLQGFQGLMFHLQAVRDMLPNRGEDAQRALEAALDKGDRALSEGRAAVQDLRASVLVHSDLEDALKSLGEELGPRNQQGGQSATYRVVVEGKPRRVDPVVRDEVYRISREALRNAFRHANARNVEAELSYGRQALGLRIRDDGLGIDPQVLEHGNRPGHWGLQGMRERAESFGGKLQVWSRAHAGTEVELTIPGASAYRKRPDRRNSSPKCQAKGTTP